MCVLQKRPQVKEILDYSGYRKYKIKTIKSKWGCKDQESIQSSTTPDPGYQWESDKLTVRHHKPEPRGQPFPSRWPQSTFLKTDVHKDIANTRQNKNIKDPQKKYRLGTVSVSSYNNALCDSSKLFIQINPGDIGPLDILRKVWHNSQI